MDRDAAPREQRHREMFFSLIGQHVKNLYHFVRHQLRHFEAVGELMPGELTVDDVVDAVLLRAYGEFVKHPPERKIRSWLIGLAREHLASEVKRLRTWRERTEARTEADIPDTPPAEWVTRLGEEILEFHEPDEDLKLEDVLPDLNVSTPEEHAEVVEMRLCVSSALAGMPKEWRRALLLRYVDGLAGAELARALGRSVPESERLLEHARQHLRQRLIEAGCSVNEPGPRASHD